jgi:hypothetical protein
VSPRGTAAKKSPPVAVARSPTPRFAKVAVAPPTTCLKTM